MQAHDFETMYSVEERHWWFRGKRKIVYDFLRNELGSVDGKQVLDLGCGTGFFSIALKQAGAHLFCADTSGEALELAKIKGLTNIFLADARNLPFGNNQFDAVIALDILEHIEDDGAAVKEILRVLKKGGILLATVPAYRFLYGPQDKRIGHFRRYTAHAIRELLADFKILRVSFYNFFLFLPVLAARAIFRLHPSVFEETDELEINNKALNFLFCQILGFERLLLRFVNLPFGVSLIAMAKKP